MIEDTLTIHGIIYKMTLEKIVGEKDQEGQLRGNDEIVVLLKELVGKNVFAVDVKEKVIT